MKVEALDQGTFRHDALLYAGRDDFCVRMGGFIRDGLSKNELVLVMVTADKIELLRSWLGEDAAGVSFEDMSVIGRNPARIIPAWRDFFEAAGAGGHVARGIDEPIWANRSPDELIESQRHEELINLAFPGARGWLVCPYDVTALDQAVVDEAYRSHPMLLNSDGRRHVSSGYPGHHALAQPLDLPLAEPAAVVIQMDFDAATLPQVRRAAKRFTSVAGLDETASDELVIAVNEVATNSVRHGGGLGTFRAWSEDHVVVCEVTDRGSVEDPLIGLVRPALGAEGGFGLWLVNQLCDLVQIRTCEPGVAVRMHRAR